MSKCPILDAQLDECTRLANRSGKQAARAHAKGDKLLAQQYEALEEVYQKARNSLRDRRNDILMKLHAEATLMKIRTFNTGRLYSAHGQRIAYCQLLRDCGTDTTTMLVAFYDLDRGLCAVIRMQPQYTEADAERALMEQYDACAYERHLLIPNDLEDALKEAAQGCASVAP